MSEHDQPYQYQAWPAWKYGPNGEAQIFESEDDVPEGWGSFPPGSEPDEVVDDSVPALRLTAAEKKAAKAAKEAAEAAEKAAAEEAEKAAAEEPEAPVEPSDF